MGGGGRVLLPVLLCALERKGKREAKEKAPQRRAGHPPRACVPDATRQEAGGGRGRAGQGKSRLGTPKQPGLIPWILPVAALLSPVPTVVPVSLCCGSQQENPLPPARGGARQSWDCRFTKDACVTLSRDSFWPKASCISPITTATVMPGQAGAIRGWHSALLHL